MDGEEKGSEAGERRGGGGGMPNREERGTGEVR